MTRLFLILIGLLISYPSDASQVVDRIIAVVDHHVITQSDLDKALTAYKKEISQIKNPKEKQAKLARARQTVLQRLVNDKVYLEELDREGIRVSDGEVEERVVAVLTQEGKTLDQLEKELKKKGGTLEDYKDYIRKDLRQNKFLKKVIYPRIRVSDYELQEYYEKHKHEYKTYKKVRFLEILITPESIPQGERPVPFMRELITKLQKGGNFKTYAEKYSKGAFASKGGDSGLVDTSELRKELADILTSLELNKVSTPIPSPEGGGYYIFKLIDRKEPINRPYNDVKEALRTRLGEELVFEEVENYMMEARTRHFVEFR